MDRYLHAQQDVGERAIKDRVTYVKQLLSAQAHRKRRATQRKHMKDMRLSMKSRPKIPSCFILKVIVSRQESRSPRAALLASPLPSRRSIHALRCSPSKPPHLLQKIHKRAERPNSKRMDLSQHWKLHLPQRHRKPILMPALRIPSNTLWQRKPHAPKILTQRPKPTRPEPNTNVSPRPQT